MPGNYGYPMGPPRPSISAADLAPMGPPRPVTADTMSSAQRLFAGLQGITGVLPFLMQSGRDGELMPTMGGGAVKSKQSIPGDMVLKDGQPARREGSTGGSGTSGASDTTSEGEEGSRTSENSKLIEALFSKMFGEDEDPEVKKLRVNLTKQKLRMELKAVQDERREAAFAKREQDRLRGQAHRERKMRDGGGVRGKIEVDEELVKRASPEQPRSRAERQAAYEKGAGKASRKKHAKNLGISESEFDYINTNESAYDYGMRLEEQRREEARARGRAKFEGGM